jgi:gliding motility-associated-like protein
MSATLFTVNNKVCSSSSNVDLTIIPNGFTDAEISAVRLIRTSGFILVNLNGYSFSIAPPIENEQVYVMIDIYNSCGESYTIISNKINIQVSPYICSGFPTTPETSITGPKTVNLGETQNYAITLDNQSDTVFTKGVPLKFDWYYEITDKGVKKYYQAFVINNVQSSAPLGSNVFVSFPGNFKQGKLVSVSSMYRLPNNEYIPFDTNYYDVEVKSMATITNALCSDSIGCSAFRIEKIQVANYTFDQSAQGIECPKGSKGYSDFTKAEFVYSDTLGNLYSLVNSYPEMYAGSTVNVSISGKDSAQYYAFWADINGDGDFTDANEFLGASQMPLVTYTGTLTLPFLDGSVSSLRLRVRSSRDVLNATDYCGAFLQTKGETEDYLVSLVPYPTLEAPQAFTPGTDGLNDFLVIRGVDLAAGPLEIKVYDKIGNLIYQNDAYLNDWNGFKSDGTKYNNGTYYITASNGSRVLKAYVELINESNK